MAVQGAEGQLVHPVLDTLNSRWQWFIHRTCLIDGWKCTASTWAGKGRPEDVEQKHRIDKCSA